MTAKQYLRQAYRLNELINSDLEELKQLRALSNSISSPNLSGMPYGDKKQEAPFENAIIKIVELEKAIDAEINNFVDLKKEIRVVINGIEDNNQQLCLRLRYLRFLKWESVACEMELSLKQVHRLHAAALKQIDIH